MESKPFFLERNPYLRKSSPLYIKCSCSWSELPAAHYSAALTYLSLASMFFMSVIKWRDRESHDDWWSCHHRNFPCKKMWELHFHIWRNQLLLHFFGFHQWIIFLLCQILVYQRLEYLVWLFFFWHRPMKEQITKKWFILSQRHCYFSKSFVKTSTYQPISRSFLTLHE